MKNRTLKLKYQAGVTLIELIIVVLIIGFLAIVGARAFSSSGVSDTAKAQALFEGCSKISTNVVLLANAAGVSSVYASNPMAATGSNLLDVIANGSGSMATAYQPAWADAGLTPLSDVLKGSAGSYEINNYPITFAGGGTAPHTCAFTVPDSVVAALVTKYGSGTAPASSTATDTTNGTIRYTASTSGNRTVTILRPL